MGQVIFHSFGGNFFTRYLSKQLADMLPRRFKRLFYVSSAMGTLLREKSPDTALVARINKKLRLAYSISGMMFPIYIGAMIWKNLANSVISLTVGPVTLAELQVNMLDDMDCWKTGALFAKNVPFWLRYGSNELMTADVHDMLVMINKAA